MTIAVDDHSKKTRNSSVLLLSTVSSKLYVAIAFIMLTLFLARIVFDGLLTRRIGIYDDVLRVRMIHAVSASVMLFIRKNHVFPCVRRSPRL